jgi:glycosyltransferase involved in cell wall biosynthesis
MRVVLLLARFFAAGQTNHVVDLARALAAAGHEVTLVSTGPSGRGRSFRRVYTHDLRQAGVEVVLSDLEGGLPPGVPCPDIIHAHSTLDFARAERLASRLHVPFVLTLHGLGATHLLAAGALARAAAVIAVGRRVAAEALTVTPRVVVIENGVDTQRFRPPSDDPAPSGDPPCVAPAPVPAGPPANRPFTVLYAGRIDPGKRKCFRDLARAVFLLADRRPVRLVVLAVALPALGLDLGSGRKREEILDFRGWRVDPSPILREADVVAGSGRVIREGMASGRPCLLAGQRYGGIVVPGTLNPAGHDFSARGTYSHPALVRRILADLTRLATNRDLARKLGQEGRAYALAHLGLERAAALTTEVYEQVLRGRASDHVGGAPANGPPRQEAEGASSPARTRPPRPGDPVSLFDPGRRSVGGTVADRDDGAGGEHQPPSEAAITASTACHSSEVSGRSTTPAGRRRAWRRTEAGRNG